MIHRMAFIRNYSMNLINFLSATWNFCYKIFSAKEDSSKLTIQNKSVHETSNNDDDDDDVRVINCATSENLIVHCIIFPHLNIYEYT